MRISPLKVPNSSNSPSIKWSQILKSSREKKELLLIKSLSPFLSFIMNEVFNNLLSLLYLNSLKKPIKPVLMSSTVSIS